VIKSLVKSMFGTTITGTILNIGIIVVFAVVATYILYGLRKKLKDEEEKKKALGDEKKDALLKMKNQNGKLKVTDD
jgi:hypothetical protein